MRGLTISGVTPTAVAACAAFALALSGCASAHSQSLPPAGGQSQGKYFPIVIPVTADPDGLSVAWRLDSTSKNGRTLRITYLSGGDACGRLKGAHIDQDSQTVTIAILLTDLPKVCADLLAMRHGTIHLTDAVGTRTLAHATASADYPDKALPPMSATP